MNVSLIDLAATPDFQLSGLRVSPSLREVKGVGQPVTLEPRVMQVLVLLAHRRGDTVSRDEMIERCWGGVVVGEDAIQRCIGRLRKLADALGGFEIETLSRVGYRLLVKETAASDLPAQTPVLAVLPFDNLSGDPDISFFSDGVAEEVLQAIARGAPVRVIGRTSSFQFRGPGKLIARIADELGATHVLDGSVRRAGERVRVRAQLIDLGDHAMVWTDRFEGSLAEVFAIQDRVAANVAAALNAVFATPARPPPPPSDAFDLLLQARELSQTQTVAANHAAALLLERVVARAPDHAEAWGLLAAARAIARWGETKDEVHVRETARANAERALALDPNCGLAHKALYLLEPPAGRFAESEAMLNRALEASPYDGEIAWALYVHGLSVGRLSASFAMAERAYRIDPLRPENVIAYANALFTANKPAQALPLMRHALDRWPQNSVVCAISLWTAAVSGATDLMDALCDDAALARFDEADRGALLRARLAAESIRAPQPRHLASAMAGLKASLEAGTPRFSALGLCAYLGADLDELYDLMEAFDFEALKRPDARLAPLDGFPNLFLRINHRLRRSPRFVHLCARLGLVEYWRRSGVWPDCVEETALHYDFVKVSEASIA